MQIAGYKILLAITVVCLFVFALRAAFREPPLPKSYVAPVTSFNKGSVAEERDRPVKARQGDLNSQIQLCLAGKIDDQSLLWCRYLADRGNEEASRRVAFANGKYFTSVKKYLEEDAEHGDVASQYELGVDYYLGLGEFPRDSEQSYFWLSLALKNSPRNYFWRSYADKRPLRDRDYFLFWRNDAANKLAQSQIIIANKELESWVPTAAPPAVDQQNPILRAAESGDVHAELTVASIYEGACCGKRNYVEAAFWRAVARKYGGAIDLRGDTGQFVDYPERHLSPGQLEGIKKRVEDWKPTIDSH